MMIANGHEPVQRRFTIADVAIFVLATALGLAAIRHDLGGLFARPKALENGQWVYRWSLPVALSKAITAEGSLLAWTAGWLALQLRRPRRRLRQLSRQPGFLACFSATVIACITGPVTWTIIASNTSGMNAWLDRMVWMEMVSSQIGAAVMAVWATLAASGRCQVRAGCLDRVGQALGLIWVAMIPANLVHFFWYCGWTN